MTLSDSELRDLERDLAESVLVLHCCKPNHPVCQWCLRPWPCPAGEWALVRRR